MSEDKYQCTKYQKMSELRHMKGWDNAHRPQCIRPGWALRWPEWAPTRRGLNPSSSADLCWHSAQCIRFWTIKRGYKTEKSSVNDPRVLALSRVFPHCEMILRKTREECSAYVSACRGFSSKKDQARHRQSGAGLTGNEVIVL